MKKYIYILSVLFIFSACAWKRGYVAIDPITIADGEKELFEIEDKNFFYLRLCEEAKPYEEQTPDGSTYYDEALVKLYKSCKCGAEAGGQKIKEETYLYMDGYETQSAGRILYLSTTVHIETVKRKKRQQEFDQLIGHYKSKTHINLSTVRKTNLGYWFKKSNGEIRIVLTNGLDYYQVAAIAKEDRLIFKRISHPNIDENNRGDESGDPMVTINEVVNVGDDEGIIFYRNYKDQKAQREVVIDDNQPVKQILIVKKNIRSKSGTSYIGTQDGEKVNFKANGHHKTNIIPLVVKVAYEESGMKRVKTK